MRKFTLAEELARLRLHRSVPAAIRFPENFLELYRSAEYHDLDRNAKRLAGALRVPEDNLRADAREVFESSRPGFPTQRALHRQLIIQLAQRDDVSWVAMECRLRDWPLRIDQAIATAFERGLTSLP